MDARSVTVRLRVDLGDAQSKLGQFATKVKQTASDSAAAIAKNSDSINSVSNKLGLLGVGLIGTAAIAVKKFADFDQAISGVKATGDDARKSIDALRQAAIDAGGRTVFTATESANAIENMAKAGVKATDILGGGLTGALALASAGTLDVADAAQIASITMNQFGLKGKDVGHIADVLAAGAGKASGEVSDLAVALKYVGPVAAQMGVSLDETAGTLALLAQNGILADNAGTGLRGVLDALTSPTEQAQKTLDKYNISAFDAQGNFVGLASLAGQLHDQLKPLDEATRSAALGQIFGNQQITTARILYDNGADAVRHWTDEVNDQGYAAEVAATKLDNLKGDIEQFGGALDTAFIKSGEGANSGLRTLVQDATNVVNAFSALPSSAQTTTLAIIGISGAALIGVAGIAKLIVAVNTTNVALKSLGSSKTVGSVAGSFARMATYGAGILALADATGELVTALTTGDASLGAAALESSVRNLAATGDLKYINAQFDNFGTFLGLARTNVDDLSSALKAVTDQSFDSKSVHAFEWLPGVESSIEVVDDRFTQLDGTLAQLASGGHADAAADAFDTIKTAALAQGISVDRLNELFPQHADALVGAKLAQDDAAAARSDFAASMTPTTTTIEDQTKALDDLVDAQSDASGVAVSVFEAQANLQQSYADATEAIKKNGATLDLTTQKGRDNQDALLAIAKSGEALVVSMRKNGASQAELQGSLQGTRDNFIAVATQMGLSKDAAGALADQLNLIPSKLTSVVDVVTDPAQTAINRFIALNTDKHIPLYLDTVTTQTHTATGNQISSRGFNAKLHADGALYAFGNGGGIDSTGRGVPRESMIASGGRNIVWAEPETGWEAYISGKPSMRNRNIGITADVAGRFGYDLVRRGQAHAFANGGLIGGGASGGGSGVTFKVDTINARDEAVAAQQLLTKARDTIAAFGIETLGGSTS